MHEANDTRTEETCTNEQKIPKPIIQKRPTHLYKLTKDIYTHLKKKLPKRPTHLYVLIKETYTYLQKRPTHISKRVHIFSKETYMYSMCVKKSHKQDLRIFYKMTYTYLQKRHPHSYQRELSVFKKEFTRETYTLIYINKRDLHISTKETNFLREENYLYLQK